MTAGDLLNTNTDVFEDALGEIEGNGQVTISDDILGPRFDDAEIREITAHLNELVFCIIEDFPQSDQRCQVESINARMMTLRLTYADRITDKTLRSELAPESFEDRWGN